MSTQFRWLSETFPFRRTGFHLASICGLALCHLADRLGAFHLQASLQGDAVQDIVKPLHALARPSDQCVAEDFQTDPLPAWDSCCPRNHRRWSRGFSMVEFAKSADPLATRNGDRATHRSALPGTGAARPSPEMSFSWPSGCQNPRSSPILRWGDPRRIARYHGDFIGSNFGTGRGHSAPNRVRVGLSLETTFEELGFSICSTAAVLRSKCPISLRLTMRSERGQRDRNTALLRDRLQPNLQHGPRGVPALHARRSWLP